MMQGFRNFILRGNVVDLAVAVIIGAAFGAVVNSMVADIITPIIGAIGGKPDFSAIKLGPIGIGKFINAVLNFLVQAAVVYFVIVVPMQRVMEKMNKHQAPAAPPAPPEDILLLREIRDALKK
ncbi:MAG: large conductance mechanosensitive channel protein MscL [Deinococcus sp.]|nr:large conductance mechanosensitive channel protein MscL [Deinococcus sp.]